MFQIGTTPQLVAQGVYVACIRKIAFQDALTLFVLEQRACQAASLRYVFEYMNAKLLQLCTAHDRTLVYAASRRCPTTI